MAELLKRRSLWQRIKEIALTDVVVLARGGVDGDTLERLEQTLLESDLGVPVTMRLVEEVRKRAARGVVRTAEDFRGALRELVAEALRAGNADAALHMAPEGPTVILVLGVNGAGKTTTIGK
jgi:fused signal recognition particle receptor